MPVNKKSGERIDVLLNPLGVYGRMNFGQLIELMIAKVVRKCEKDIVNNKNNIEDNLKKLAELSGYLNSHEYKNKIINLAEQISQSEKLKDKFYNDVKSNGLFFEAPCFASFDIIELNQKVNTLFNNSNDKTESVTMDDVIVKKELFEHFKNIMEIDISDECLPEGDVVYEKIFNGPLYITKLLHLSTKAFMSRDFGEYNTTNRQPTKSVYEKDNGSRIGNMEVDAFLSHNTIKPLKEILTVKSDSLEAKTDLVTQMIKKGEYQITEDSSSSTYTKILIESLITFLNN